MRSGVALACLMLAAGAAPLRAQAPQSLPDQQCRSGTGSLEDACQKAADLFKLLAPQLGALVAGGNATLGDASTLGGAWRYSLELRLNAVQADLPDLAYIAVDTGSAQRADIGVWSMPAALPAVDGAVGLWRGATAGAARVGGVDLLLSALYLPSLTTRSIGLHASGVRLGYGLRVGIIEGSPSLPNVVVTLVRRDLPSLEVAAISGEDTVAVRPVTSQTTAWRIVAGRDWGALTLVAGGGQERYVSSARIYAALSPASCGGSGCSGYPFPDPFRQHVTRTSMFADAMLRLGRFGVVGEIGRTWGGDIATFNGFRGSGPNAARWMGALGLRLTR